MRVDLWFFDWLGRHCERHPRSDWPSTEDGRLFYGGWLGVFVRHGITEDVADEVSVRLMDDPPKFVAEHIPALVKAAREVFRERAAQGKGPATDSREAALAASRECEDCSGQGLTVRYRQRSADPTGFVRPEVVCYCRCAMGRWIERSHREKSPELRKRIINLDDNLWLEDEVYRRAPERLAVEAADGPLAPPLRQLPYVLPSPTIVRGEHGGLMCLVFLADPAPVAPAGRGDAGCEDVPDF
jgi:hypothetical protein